MRKFGNENMSHISPEMMEEYISFGDIGRFIQDIHFNPNVLENQNVKRIMRNQTFRKTEFLATLGENSLWSRAKRDDVLIMVINNACNILQAFVLQNVNNLDKNIAAFHSKLRAIKRMRADVYKAQMQIFTLMCFEEFYVEL